MEAPPELTWAGEYDVYSRAIEQPLAAAAGPTATLVGGPTAGVAPLRVYLDGTTSKPAADGSWIARCQLDYGDGQSADVCWGFHNYPAGAFTARFTATDNLGRSTTAQLIILASGPMTPDAGTPAPDAGTVVDSGTPVPDAGAPVPDAGTPPANGLRWYGSAEGVPWARSVSADEAGVIWAVHDTGILTLAPGQSRFTSHTGVGQLTLGDWPYTVCGGEGNRAYVGYVSPESLPVTGGTPEQRLRGDLDRLVLNANGTVSVEKHYQLVNTNDAAFDEVRTVVGCVRQNARSSPYYGELYVGSNHAVTRIRGDDIADHRHVVFAKPNGTLVIGYNWAVALEPGGALFFANEYKLGILQPTPALLDWLSFQVNPYSLDTYVDLLGPLEDPDRWHAAAVTPDGKHWLGSWGKGLLWMTPSPRAYQRVLDAPDSQINALAAEADNSVWVATQTAGLWRYGNGTWTALPLPAKKVLGLFLDTRTSPRTLYIATDRGIGVYQGP